MKFECGYENGWEAPCQKACPHCGCCGDDTDGLFPLVDQTGHKWCQSCWDNERPSFDEDIPELIERTGALYRDVCYRHEWDEQWAELMEEVYGY